jgi:hypothetical protein
LLVFRLSNEAQHPAVCLVALPHHDERPGINTGDDGSKGTLVWLLMMAKAFAAEAPFTVASSPSE